LETFLNDYDLSDLDSLSEAILNRSEQAMRSAITDLPDGTYSYQVYADGVQDTLEVHTTVSIQGDEVSVDFEGSSPEFVHCSINCVYNDTFADTYYPLKCSLLPDLPNNEGIFRPIQVHAAEGSVFNTCFPRAVRARSKASFHIHAAIYGALAQAMPGKVQAGSGSFWSLTAFGVDAEGQRYRSHYLPNGGKGACLQMDGLPTIAFPYNGTATPAEILENTAPILVLRRELITDSGGAGCWRGGLGQSITITPRDSGISGSVTVFVRPDKLRHPPNGLLGGHPGSKGSLRLNGQDVSFDAVHLTKGDRLELELPGGGGMGDPLERPAQLVSHDARQGYVTPRFAREHYAVVLDREGNLLAEETGSLRQKLTKRRRET
jgi:N-methylhydantoinase B/oxoprolinase/acetone carboxylase alpha subunit